MLFRSLTAAGLDNGIDIKDLKTVLPSSLTNDSTVIATSASGVPVTLGNVNAMVSKNPSMSITTVLDDVYKLNADEFSKTFTPSVLNGTTAYQTSAELETKARSAGFPSYASYSQYNGDISAYNNAVNNNLATAAGFP
mgnify:FL=1